MKLAAKSLIFKNKAILLFEISDLKHCNEAQIKTNGTEILKLTSHLLLFQLTPYYHAFELWLNTIAPEKTYE